MKNIKLLLLALLFIAAPSLKAQDIIITQEGDSHKVYEVEISASSVFYKLENKADAALQKMKKSDVLMIKFQDGRKVIIGEDESSTPAQNPTTEAVNEPTAPLTHSPEIIRKNQEWIEQYNKENTFTFEETPKKNKIADYLYCIFGYSNNSILFTDDIRVDISFGYMPEAQFHKFSNANKKNLKSFMNYSCLYLAFEIKISNTSNKTVYLDLGNSFVTQFNGEAITMYAPSATTTTESKSGGVGVNLGAVSSALGVGGAAGTLAQGVNVGGGKTTGTSTVTYSQRIIAIPAKSSKVLGHWNLFKIDDKISFFHYCKPVWANDVLRSYKNITVRNKESYNEENTPLKLTATISYSHTEDCSSLLTLNSQLYCKEILGEAIGGGNFMKFASKIKANTLFFTTNNHKEK